MVVEESRIFGESLHAFGRPFVNVNHDHEQVISIPPLSSTIDRLRASVRFQPSEQLSRIDVPSIEVDGGACGMNVNAVVVSGLDVVAQAVHRSTQILNEAVDTLLRNLRPGTVNRRCKR